MIGRFLTWREKRVVWVQYYRRVSDLTLILFTWKRDDAVDQFIAHIRHARAARDAAVAALMEQHAMSKSLHEQMGSKKNKDGSIDLTDPAQFASISSAYNAKIASGEFKLLSGHETKVNVPGRKVWDRTFRIDEGPESA